jgi:hypothetical protein
MAECKFRPLRTAFDRIFTPSIDFSAPILLVGRLLPFKSYSTFLFWLDFSTETKNLEYFGDNYPQTVFVSHGISIDISLRQIASFEPLGLKMC